MRIAKAAPCAVSSGPAVPALALMAACVFGAAAAMQAGLSGDRLATKDGDLTIHPVNHATLVLGWKDQVVYVDPVGGAARFAGLPKPTMVLITDVHGDHLDSPTLQAAIPKGTTMIVAPAVAAQLPQELRGGATLLANGESASPAGIRVEAVPAYNLTPDRLKFHAKGRGNGYLLTMGGRRIYISGDTEDIPEMRALKDIDVAFVCMNLPYTMDVEQAARGVLAFQPRVVYPYHSRGSDLERFKSLIGADRGIEVRIRDWYSPPPKP